MTLSTAKFGSPTSRFGAVGGTFGDLDGNSQALFHDLLRISNTSAVVVEVWSPSLLLGQLEVTGGSVTVDSSAEFRRRMTITCADPSGSLTADTADAWLTPYGHEVRIYRGVLKPDGEVEAARLGVFCDLEVDVDDSGGGVTVSVAGPDRSATIARKWARPFPIPAGTNVADAVGMVLLAKRPDLDPNTGFNLAATEATTPDLVFGLDDSSDAWKDALSLAASAGLELFYDGGGNPVLRPVPTVAGSPVAAQWVEGDGTTVSALLSVGRRMSGQDKENHVVATAEGTGIDVPLVAEAMDTNPRSKTYVGGPYGDRVVRVSTSLATSQEALQAFADAELARRLGAADSVEITTLVDPERDAGEVVRIKRGRANVNDLFLIDGLEIPLAADQPMKVTARRQPA